MRDAGQIAMWLHCITTIEDESNAKTRCIHVSLCDCCDVCFV